MSKFIKIFNILLTAMMIGSCEQSISTTPPEPPLQIRNIFFETHPDRADIYIDGANSSYKTPDSVSFFYNREYAVTFKKKFFRDTTIIINPFSLPSGKVFIDYLKNSKMLGKIRCYTNPAGAAVFFEDSLTGIVTPDTLKQITPGRHKINFLLTGYFFDSVYTEVYSNFTSDAVVTLRDSLAP